MYVYMYVYIHSYCIILMKIFASLDDFLACSVRFPNPPAWLSAHRRKGAPDPQSAKELPAFPGRAQVAGDGAVRAAGGAGGLRAGLPRVLAPDQHPRRASGRNWTNIRQDFLRQRWAGYVYGNARAVF